MVPLALPAAAQPAANGAASIAIIRPLSITQTAQLNFGRIQPQGNGNPGTATISAAPPTSRTSNGVTLLPGGAETPAIRTLSGEPGRVYRVTIPASVPSIPEGHTINQFTLWSANLGLITSTKLGQLDAAGTDTLRLGATISLPKGAKQITPSANVPITISYE